MHNGRKYKEMEWTEEKIRRFWDYESRFPQNYFTYQVGGAVDQRLYKYFLSAKNVLDYGCGTGFLIPHLLEKNFQVSALDFSYDSISEINRKFSNHPLFKGAFFVDELIKKGGKFDAIIAIEVIEHLNDFYLQETMKNFNLLLSDAGVTIVTTPNNEELGKKLVYCPNCETVFHRWQHVRSWSIESLSDFLTKRGFEVIDVFTTDFSLEPYLSSRKFLLKKKIRDFVKFKLLGLSNHANNLREFPHLIAVFKIKK